MAKAPGLVERRGRGWRVVIRVNGGRYQFGPRTEKFLAAAKTRNEVDEWVWRKHKELQKAAKREADGLPRAVHFSELVKQYRAEEMPTLSKGAQAAYQDSLKPIGEYFRDHLGDPTLDRIHSKHIKAYLSWRRVNRRNGKAPLSNRTIVKDRAMLHRLFAFADRLEYREGNPVSRVPAPKCDEHAPVILTADQYEALLTECAKGGAMLHLYTLLLGEAGPRAYSEALRLQWEDVDLEGGFLWIASGREGHRTKSGKGRWVPMTPRLRQAMREHFATFRFAAYNGSRSRWVFHHTRTRKPFYVAGQRIHDLRGAFDSAVKRAKLPKGFRRHDLRHRRVTGWLAEGKDVVLVKEAMGHADLRTTMGYTHLSREHLRSLVDEPERQTGRAGQGTGA